MPTLDEVLYYLPVIAFVSVAVAFVIWLSSFITGGGDRSIFKVLRSVPFFKALTKNELKIITSLAEIVVVKKNELVFNEGSLGDSMFVVKSGQLKISRRIDGAEVSLTSLKKGGVVGEIALLTGQPRTASALAVKKSTLIRIEREDFAKISEKNKKFKEIMWLFYSWRAFDLALVKIPELNLSQSQRQKWYSQHFASDLMPNQEVKIPKKVAFIFIVSGSLRIFEYVKEGPLLVRLKDVSKLTAIDDARVVWLPDRPQAS